MKRTVALGTLCCFVTAAWIAQAVDPGARDLWVHPRGDAYEPKIHYKAPTGELFYHAENDIEGTLDDFRIEQRRPLRLSIGLGRQLVERAREGRGSLRPVFLWDSNGDGKVDRSSAGRIVDGRALFEPPDEVDLSRAYFQIGVRFAAGADGDRSLDRRYLASVDSSALAAKLPETPDVAAAPVEPAPGLQILKRRGDTPFDFAAFLADPGAHVPEFDALTRAADADDWTIDEDGGRLVTHFERDDLFIVRATGGLGLEVLWGDLPLESYLKENLKAEPDDAGCYNTRDVALVSENGTKPTVPQRILYCPGQAFAFFDAPDGYEASLAATRGEERIDATEAGTSIRDNLRLYAKEINPRSASSRATGTVAGNLRASFAAAGDDLLDLGRHAFVGETRTHQHEGTESYRVSPVQMLPYAVYDLARMKPGSALGRIFTGLESGVQTVADAVSAANNAVVVPLAQVTVGPSVSPSAADSVGDGIGVVTSAVAKNLPASERMQGAWNPLSFARHDRAYAPSAYTRTDTQLNIDRLLSVLDAYVIGAVIEHNQNHGHHHSGDGDGGGDGGGGGPPPPEPPPHTCP